jgi:hypothetical protein
MTTQHTDRDHWRDHARNTGVRMRADGVFFGEPDWCLHGRNALSDCEDCEPATESTLLSALEAIDAEAPDKEPRAGPTVGFQPSSDPEQDDGNDTVEEAFREGVARGLWEAAQIARTAIALVQGAA